MKKMQNYDKKTRASRLRKCNNKKMQFYFLLIKKGSIMKNLNYNDYSNFS